MQPTRGGNGKSLWETCDSHVAVTASDNTVCVCSLRSVLVPVDANAGAPLGRPLHVVQEVVNAVWHDAATTTTLQRTYYGWQMVRVTRCELMVCMVHSPATGSPLGTPRHGCGSLGTHAPWPLSYYCRWPQQPAAWVQTVQEHRPTPPCACG
jgi:hypothetical protein